ncbi:MAG: methyltransferase, partial [Planctomycetota bacterium]
MTSKERVSAALNHQQPDQVPIDFGSTPVTGMHVSCVAAMRDYYGLEKSPVKVHEPYQMLGLIEEDLMEAMGIDVQSATTRSTMFGFSNEKWKPWKTQQGLEVLVSENFNTTVDENGDTLMYPQGDTSAPPSGRMPKGGFYFDTIVRQEPIDEDKLNPQDNLEEFKPITQEALESIKSEVEKVTLTGRAVAAGFGGTAFGDIALVPAPFLKHPKGIRDIAEWYISTVSRRDYIHKVFAGQCEIALANLEKCYAAVGDAVDVTFICGTDFGTQSSTFCSEETYRDLYMPYYVKVNNWIHENTKWKTFKHSCGSVVKFMEAFIESGFDIINPVQCSAAGMDPQMLKNKYGDRIVFWGAGVDTQKTLPFGTPEEIREQVLRRCEIFSKNGGFIFNSIHNVQSGTPVENI